MSKKLEDLPSKAMTVSEFTSKIRGELEPKFSNVWLQGEVSNLRPASSGHLYFSLKDEGANISVVYFGWGAKKRLFQMKDGLQVLVKGKISVYPPRGNYQLVIDQIEPLGSGALQIAFEELKNRLKQQGLFDPARKRPLPKYPKKIGIITSPSGAAIKDMLTVLARRAPHIQVLIIPATVQGDGAAGQIIKGIEIANLQPDLEMIVLSRGGGSIEDLWCFNDEKLANTIFNSRLPVMSAVGHEIDFTISDFVADLRAPTPSAGAEILSTHWVDIRTQVIDSHRRLIFAFRAFFSLKKNIVSQLRLRLISPKDKIREQMQRSDDLHQRLERSFRNLLERKRSQLLKLMASLDAMSPLKVLERGYSVVFKEDNIISKSEQIRSGDRIKIKFFNGEIYAKSE